MFWHKLFVWNEKRGFWGKKQILLLFLVDWEEKRTKSLPCSLSLVEFLRRKGAWWNLHTDMLMTDALASTQVVLVVGHRLIIVLNVTRCACSVENWFCWISLQSMDLLCVHLRERPKKLCSSRNKNGRYLLKCLCSMKMILNVKYWLIGQGIRICVRHLKLCPACSKNLNLAWDLRCPWRSYWVLAFCWKDIENHLTFR